MIGRKTHKAKSPLDQIKNDMPDVAASYGSSLDFVAFLFRKFTHNLRALLSEVSYIKQTFTYCVSN